MKRLFTILAILSLFIGTANAQKQSKRVWSETVADGFIDRYPDPNDIHWYKQSNHFTWQAGYVMFAMEHLWRQTNNKKYYDYIRRYVDQNVDKDGNVTSFKPTALDNFIPGYACLLLYEQTGEERYKKAAETIRRGFDTYPRTDEDMFFHSHSIRQVWVDGVFMGQMFLARYAKTLNHPEDFAEVVKQMKGITKLCGNDNGMFYHAYYPGKGHSAETWSEGMGWLAVLWSDVFDYLPKTQEGRDELLGTLRKMCKGLKAVQDKNTGMWCQVVDKPYEEGNWNETSGTGMFMYLIQNAIHKGFIPASEYQEVVDKAYKGIIQKAIVNADGFTNLIDCSSIGVKNDYKAYVSQTHEISTFAAYGSFILGTGIVEHDYRTVFPKEFYATDYTQGKILKFREGEIVWSYNAPLCNDLCVIGPDDVLFTTGNGVKEVDEKGNVVLEYNSDSHVFACQRLNDGNTFVGECENGRLLTLNKKGKVIKSVNILPKGTKKADMAFMRNARVLPNGNYLVAHYGPEEVVEYNAKGKAVWTIKVPGRPHSALRLPNGNTLIAVADANNNPRIIEVNNDKKVVWEMSNNDIAGKPLRFMSGMQYVDGVGIYATNWQGHSKTTMQPHAFLITRDKKVKATLKPMEGIKSISNISVIGK